MNEINLTVDNSAHVFKIRGLKKNGMTVRELIHELQLQNPNSKVVWYDVNGGVHNVINAVRDGDRKVGIF